MPSPSDLCATSGCEHRRDEHTIVLAEDELWRPCYGDDDCVRFSEPVPVSDDKRCDCGWEPRERPESRQHSKSWEVHRRHFCPLRLVSDVHSTNDPEPWVHDDHPTKRADRNWGGIYHRAPRTDDELRAAGIVPRSDDGSTDA